MNEPVKQAVKPLIGSIAPSAASPADYRLDQGIPQEPKNIAVAARVFFNRAPPPQYLEEWVERLAQPEEHVQQDLLSLVIFRLHDEYLAVQTRWLVEVTLPQPIHAIPHRTNDVVLGLVNIRGQLRICCSAHGLLGVSLPTGWQPTQRNEFTPTAPHVASLDRMLILHERAEQWVFPVDEVLGVHRLPMLELRPVPSTFGKAGAFSQTVFTWARHTVGYLDETRFLSGLTECLQVSGDLSGFSLYDLFRTEAESQTAILSEGILALEQSGSSPTAIEPLMRAAHSLKGAARIVGMNAAERLAHALEEVFVAAQKGTRVLDSSHVDVLLASVDLLGEVSRIAEGGVNDWLAQHTARLEGQVDTLLAIERGSSIAPIAEPSPASPTVTIRTIPLPQDTAPPVTNTPPGENEPTQPAPLVDVKPGTQTERPLSTETFAAIRQTGPSDSGSASAERVVRVSAENLNRLMGLAGESLVQSRQLRPLIDDLKQLKQEQTQLWNRLQALEHQFVESTQAEAEHPREQVVAAKHQVVHCLELLGGRMERLEDHARRGEDLSERLHHEVISSRLRPLVDGVRGFSRLVRDTARQLGIQVRFDIVGEKTGVDRDILEKLEAPLNHLIRNALDHGVELPDKRRSAGKDPQATIRLEARHVAGMLQVRLSDDGQGIDPERVRAKVIDRGLAPAAMAAKMAEAELFEFLFLPGFSTKAEVTSLSGRGVGLDVVQSMVQSVGGSVRLTSQLGAGTCFTLQLPITMSVIRALIVHIAGEPYAFPLSRLESIQRVEASAVETLEGRPFFTLDGETVGLVPATQVLDLPQAPSTAGPLPVAVLSDRGSRFGVVVDKFMGERDLDVRPTDPRLGKIPNISTASVLEDGWPVLIIDVEDMVRSIDNLLHGRRFKLTEATANAAATKRTKRILVVDDSITVRELERQLLESRGYGVDVAVDGMDGWNAVRSVQYDLVVSDVDMPRMDGIELVSQIKRDSQLRALPVIIVSYKDREEDRIRGLDAGASSYLTKSSFHDQKFLDTVSDLIGEAIE